MHRFSQPYPLWFGSFIFIHPFLCGYVPLNAECSKIFVLCTIGHPLDTALIANQCKDNLLQSRMTALVCGYKCKCLRSSQTNLISQTNLVSSSLMLMTYPVKNIWWYPHYWAWILLMQQVPDLIRYLLVTPWTVMSLLYYHTYWLLREMVF